MTLLLKATEVAPLIDMAQAITLTEDALKEQSRGKVAVPLAALDKAAVFKLAQAAAPAKPVKAAKRGKPTLPAAAAAA